MARCDTFARKNSRPRIDGRRPIWQEISKKWRTMASVCARKYNASGRVQTTSLGGLFATRCVVLPRADAGHRAPLLRDLLPDRAPAVDPGARVLPCESVASRHTKLRRSSCVCPRCGAGAGPTESAKPGGRQPGGALSVLAGGGGDAAGALPNYCG